jgi:hypothetical protein
MRWNAATRPGQGCEDGRSAWTSASSLRSKRWRWHARPSGGLLIRSCPLADVCVARANPRPGAMDLGPEAGRANAGSDAAWPASDTFSGLWLGCYDELSS